MTTLYASQICFRHIVVMSHMCNLSHPMGPTLYRLHMYVCPCACICLCVCVHESVDGEVVSQQRSCTSKSCHLHFPLLESAAHVCMSVCLCIPSCMYVCMCCSVLQYVAVCCSVLQYVAVCCSVLQCVAVCCSVYCIPSCLYVCM